MKITIALSKKTLREAAALGNELTGPYIAKGCHCIGCVVLRKVRAEIRKARMEKA